MWDHGEVIVRREVLGQGQRLGPWEASSVIVVEDRDDLLVTFLPAGAPLAFGEGEWPTADGLHPWHARSAWEGHGVLMLQRPDEAHAVWHFWDGPDRAFRCWYLNLQAPFRRTSIGYDTQDLELDIVVAPDGSFELKDLEYMDQRVAEGRFTPELVAEVIADGDRIMAELVAGRHWWDHSWSSWEPDPTWVTPTLPDGWADVPFDLT